MHSVSVAGVTLHENGSILCIRRRDTGAWQIPGGVLERGETIQAGLCREVAEETGAFVRPVRLTGVYLKPWPGGGSRSSGLMTGCPWWGRTDRDEASAQGGGGQSGGCR
ncbi:MULTISPECIES: NUDIX hydrolase [Frankia]|uniref:NUDIX hydrolase n=1 Tax=Frankia TaxID=1854 RepID=UPI0009E2C05E|nr:MULTISPECIES: NUDIX hydrolase [Frankia]